MPNRIRELAVSLNQLRVEQDLERERRSEEDRIRSEQAKALLQELTSVTTEGAE